MSKSILVVDDSPSMRQMVAFTLQEEGHPVVEAGTGEAGRDAFTPGIGLVITDVNMPGMSGIDLIRDLRSKPASKFTPIIVLTTESDTGKQAEGKAAGATAWLVKPFTPEKLLETVKRVLA